MPAIEGRAGVTAMVFGGSRSIRPGGSPIFRWVELRGFEPLTFSLRRLEPAVHRRSCGADRVQAVRSDGWNPGPGVRRGSARSRAVRFAGRIPENPETGRTHPVVVAQSPSRACSRCHSRSHGSPRSEENQCSGSSSIRYSPRANSTYASTFPGTRYRLAMARRSSSLEGLIAVTRPSTET